MDKSMVPAKTFVFKTNIHCSGCEKKMKKLLQNINGVHTISIDADQGKVTISGTIDPQTVLKLLEKAGKKSELLWAMNNHNNLQITTPQSKSENNYHGIHDKDMVKQLQQISEIKGLKSVEVTKNRFRLTFKEHYDENDFQDFHGHGGICSARNSTSAMHNLHDFCGHHETCCARNSACYMQRCNGCRLPPPTPCRCTNSQGNILSGIPWPGSIPSAPPEVVPEYYDTRPPPPPPPPPVMAYPYDTTFSDENPRSCTVM